MPKTVHLQYVAMLKDRVGNPGETVTTAASSVEMLYQEVAQRYHLPWPAAAMRPAINDNMVSWTTELEDGDRVIFLPPASGG